MLVRLLTRIVFAVVFLYPLAAAASAQSAHPSFIGATGAAPEAVRPWRAKADEAQATGMTSVRVIMADKARHVIMLDHPAFLFSALDDFLAARRPTRER